MSDEDAVLIEPFACSVRAVRSNLPAAGEHVLVIGAGSIGLLATAAVRVMAPAARVTVLARHEFQAEHAKKFGAANVIRAKGNYLKHVADAGGTRLLKPILGKPIGIGGFDLTFVCVAGARGMDDAMRFTRAGGTIVLLGNSGAMGGLDWTPLWLKELTVRGSVYYGAHHHTVPAERRLRRCRRLHRAGQGERPSPAHAHLPARRLPPGARDRDGQARRGEREGGVQVLAGSRRRAPRRKFQRSSTGGSMPQQPLRSARARRALRGAARGPGPRRRRRAGHRRRRARLLRPRRDEGWRPQVGRPRPVPGQDRRPRLLLPGADQGLNDPNGGVP